MNPTCFKCCCCCCCCLLSPLNHSRCLSCFLAAVEFIVTVFVFSSSSLVLHSQHTYIRTLAYAHARTLRHLTTNARRRVNFLSFTCFFIVSLGLTRCLFTFGLYVCICVCVRGITLYAVHTLTPDAKK